MSAAGVSLRDATPGDAGRIADVLLASRKAFVAFAPLAHTDDEVRGWVRDVLLPAGGVTVAVADATIVAFMDTCRDGEASWVKQLFAMPGHTGQGVGSMLLARALEALPPPIRLYCFQQNSRARAFYERHGFRAIAFGDGSANEEGCPDVLYERTG